MAYRRINKLLKEDFMHNNHSQITLFDTMVTPDHLQEIKVVLPYLPYSLQRFVGIYSKIEELRNTFFLFDHRENLEEFSAKDKTPETVLDELKNYLSDEQMESIQNLSNLRAMMEMFDDAENENENSPLNIVNIFEMMNGKGAE